MILQAVVNRHQGFSSLLMPIQQLDEQLRRYEDLAKRASELRSYL